MVKKILLKDFDGNELLPITRGELILDPSGKMALRSTQYLATSTLPGLMSPEDKYKIDNMSASSVAHDLVLKIKSGTVEGTDLYTFNGSADKILDFQQGSGITLLPEANKMTISNSGVRAISESNVNGTISVNTNGTVANVSIKGLGSAAFTASSVYSVRQQLINEDLNNIITPGFYNAGSGNSVTNKPSNIDNFGLIVIHSATDSHYIQLLFKGEVVWRRHCISGEWSIWKKDECYNVVSSTSNGLTPMIGTESASTIGSQSNEWVLASTSGATPTWRKLPSNAFNNTTYTLSGALSAGGFTTTLTSSTGSTSTSTVPIMGGATSSASGSVGLVPTPSSNTAFLRGDGTWSTPLDTHYTTHLYIGATNSASNSSTTNGNTYIKLFDNSTLRHQYKIIGGGVTTVNSDSDGNLTISSSVKWSDISDKPSTFTPSTHNHPSSQITSLTGYSKATSPSDLSTTDTLNSALGKLEYKSDLTYDWYLSITQEDTDDIINKWGEIVDFIDSVAEGTDITDEFVTRKTAQTITGAKSFSTVVNITGTTGFSEGIRLHHYDNLSSLWFGAVNNSGYDPGMWGITVDSNGMRFRGTSSTTGTSASDYVNIIHGGNVGIGTTNPSHKLHVNGNILASKFIGTLNSTLTFSAGAFAAKTYDNSAAVTVNIPTHTSHLTNNSGFLTQHQSLANYVTLNTAQTITGAKTFAANTLTISNPNGGDATLKFYRGGNTAWSIVDTGGNLKFNDLVSNTTRLVLYESAQGGSAAFGGTVTATKFITSGGTSSQFVKGDGSLDSTSYATTTQLGKYLPLSGGTLTGDINTKSFMSGTDGLGLYIEGESNLGLRIQYNKSTTGSDYDQLLLRNGVLKFNSKEVIHSGNYNSYSPTLTGTGASGTWGINITGNAGSATNSDTVDSLHSYAFKKTWNAYAGGSYIGWVTIAKWTASTASHFTFTPFMLSIYRHYNSPSSESYTFSISSGWDTAHITQVSGNAGTRIIEKLRIAKCSDNLTYRLEMYVNTYYATYQNPCSCVVYGYDDSNFSATTVCELTANVASTLAEVTTASNSIVGNLSGNATSATKVIVNQHTTNNNEYPLVWSNSISTSTTTGNQLYKSYSHLTYNPSAHRISTGQYIANNNAGPHFTAQSTTGNWAYLRLNNGSTYWDIATRSDSGSGGLWLARLKGGDNGIFVSTDNNVGISTSSPSEKLHVNGNAIATNFGVNSTAGSGQGISLYGGSGYVTTCGIMFATTSNYGVHGYVSGDWATYFTMSNTENRGWIFRRNGSGNVFSIDCDGHAYANGLVNASRFSSRAATGIQPYACTSTTCNTNLNADLLDGQHASGLFTNLSNSGNNISITIGGTNKILTPAYATSAGNADYATSAPAAANYGTTGSTTKIKVKINSTTSWMLSFVVTLYQGYKSTKIMISGYNYGSNYWYEPEAVLLGDSNGATSISVYFGYDSSYNLWVGFDGGIYTGVSVSDVTNGYNQISSLKGLFTISNVSSLTTLQKTVTATNSVNYAVSASSATTASKLGSSTVGSTYQPIYLSSGTATAGTSYAKAIKAITRSGTTFTYTCLDGSSGTFTQQDNNTTYNFSGVSFTSGNSSTGTHDCNSITSNGVWYYNANGPTTTLGASTTDGALYSQAYSTSWVAQIAQDYRDGDLFTRGRNNGTWTAWKRVAYFSEITKANVGLGNVQNTAFYKRVTTVNGATWNMAGTTSSAAFTIYAPTTVGTDGYVLKSNGSGAPSWVAQSTLSVSYSASTGALGRADVGSATQPIYLDSGVPKACTAYASASVNYANSAGVASKVSGTLKFVGGAFATATYNGSANVSVNVPTSTSHLTNDNNFVHRSDSTSAVGGLARPVYVTSDGLVYACSYTLGANVNNGTASKLAYYSAVNTIDDYTASAGSATQPMYLNEGVPAACTYSLKATVNAGTSGKLARYSGTNAISSYSNTVGNSNTPVYINAGVPAAISITASTSTLYVLGTITGGTIYKGGTSTTTGVHITSGKVLNAPGGFYETSDARLKNFISDINIDFDKLRTIPKKYFTWKNKNKVNIGTSAQELLKIYPEIVNEGEDGILTVAYDKLSIIALKAIDQLYDEILKLRQRIKTLEENK